MYILKANGTALKTKKHTIGEYKHLINFWSFSEILYKSLENVCSEKMTKFVCSQFTNQSMPSNLKNRVKIIHRSPASVFHQYNTVQRVFFKICPNKVLQKGSKGGNDTSNLRSEGSSSNFGLQTSSDRKSATTRIKKFQK